MKHTRIESDDMKNEYQLVLHDYGNLSMQIIQESTEVRTLEVMAERMNYLFAQAGKSKQFEATVHLIENPNG